MRRRATWVTKRGGIFQLGLLPIGDIGTVISGDQRLADVVLHHSGGFDILAGRSGSGALAGIADSRLDAVLAELHDAAARYDDVLLDLGAGIEAGVRRMARFADLLLVIATEEPTSLTDAYAVLKLHTADLATHGGKARPSEARIVVNQAASPQAGARVYATLARACTAFLGHTPALAGIIRRDDRVRDAIRRQTLLLARHPTTPAAVDIERLAGALSRPS